MRSCIALSLLFLSLGLFGQSDYPNVLIEHQSQTGYPPCEPSIAVSPVDPAIQVAGAILDRVYTSVDSGKTWQAEQLTSPLGVFGDPTLIAGPKGDFYYFHLSDPSGKGWSDESLLDRIVCQYSSDNGANWSDGAGIGLNGTADQDKQWSIVGPKGKHVYTTWTQFDKYNSKQEGDSTLILFSCSPKGGEEWAEPTRLSQYAGNCLDDDMTVEGAVPAVARNGNIYVTWARGDCLYFDKSTNGGKTWLDEDIVAGYIMGGWDQDIPGINRCNGMPVTMVDNSGGAFDGSIYVVYSSTVNGVDDTDIFMVYSRDEGETWSDAVRVNNDLLADEVDDANDFDASFEREMHKGDGEGDGSHQFFPWLAVDQSTGHLYTVFYDRRNYDDLQTDVYLATSTDGGITWLNERISESPFTPTEFVFFGDYNNISAVNGVVRPIWTRCAEGKLSVWTALINK